MLSYSSTGTTLEGREEILTYGREVIYEVYEYCMHTSQSPRLAVDGDTGSGIWYTLVFYASRTVTRDGSPGSTRTSTVASTGTGSSRDSSDRSAMIRERGLHTFR